MMISSKPDLSRCLGILYTDVVKVWLEHQSAPRRDIVKTGKVPIRKILRSA